MCITRGDKDKATKCSNKQKDHPKCNIWLFIKHQAPSHPPPRTISLTFSHDVGDNTEEPSARNLIIRLCVLLIENTPPHLLGFQSSITKTCPNIFIFSLRHYTMQHACLFQFLSHDLHCGVTRARAHTHTHTHTVPDVCRKLNQTLRLNHLPPMSLTFILLYQIYPSIRSTLPHRLTSRSTCRINTGALSSSSSRSIINSLKTKT